MLLTLGQNADVEVAHRVHTIVQHVAMMRQHPELDTVARAVWPRVLLRIATRESRWLKVTGPASEVAASLYELGWLPAAHNKWIAPCRASFVGCGAAAR